MDFILFGHITRPRLMAATIASLRSLLMFPWHCVNKTPDQQTVKTSALIEVLTLDNQRYLIISLTVTYPLNSYVNSKGVLILSHMHFPFWLYFC